MLIDVRTLRSAFPCTILGVGHSDLDESCRYSNQRFITEALSDDDRLELFQRFEPTLETVGDLKRLDPQRIIELTDQASADFEEAVGIKSRVMYDGPLFKLAAMAARPALEMAQLEPTAVDFVMVGTNTPDRLYATTTDELILELGAHQNPFGFNMHEACTTGMAAVFVASSLVRATGMKILVVMVDKATTLAKRGYKRRNLFGDRAGAMVLGPGSAESFQFFAGEINPFDGNIGIITQRPDGFEQNGGDVLRYMGKKVPEHLRGVLQQLGIAPVQVDHLFPHTPSVRALDKLLTRLRHLCPDFRGIVHGDVANVGNTSCATTPTAISEAWRQGQLESGQLCVVSTFGAGMSIGQYGFIVP